MFSVESAFGEPPSVEFISAGLRSQLTGGAVELNYSFKNSRRADDRAYKYLRNSRKQYLECRVAEGTTHYQSFESEFNRGTFLTVRGAEKRAAVTDETERDELGLARLLDPVLLNLPEGPLCDVIAKGRVLPDTTIVEGAKCWRVEIGSERAYPRYVIFVDLELGCCPRRVEYYYSKGFSLTSTLSDYRQISERVWYPWHMRLAPVYEGVPAAERQLSVATAACVDPASVDLIKVVFPSGTQVRDLVLDAEYTVP
jgi:hypothetical protein